MSDKEEKENHADKEGTFDIYHFFSRWDILAAAAFIVLLLLLLAYFVFIKPSVA
ncbi:MAG: hypothetical protein ACK4NR_10175 [Micavibrio sp.]